MSYNSRGFCGLKQEFCRNLLVLCGDKIPVICNQENFLLRGNSYKVQKALPNCHILFKSAKKENLDKGRPANGMFIALPMTYNSSILDVSPEHWRLQAAILKADKSDLLIINSYFPTDKALLRIDEAELEEIFAAIEEVIDNNKFSSFQADI